MGLCSGVDILFQGGQFSLLNQAKSPGGHHGGIVSAQGRGGGEYPDPMGGCIFSQGLNKGCIGRDPAGNADAAAFFKLGGMDEFLGQDIDHGSLKRTRHPGFFSG